MTTKNNFLSCGKPLIIKRVLTVENEQITLATTMEIKIFPLLLCALILLWTTREVHGYTSPWTHGSGGDNTGRKKKTEIWAKVSSMSPASK